MIDIENETIEEIAEAKGITPRNLRLNIAKNRTLVEYGYLLALKKNKITESNQKGELNKMEIDKDKVVEAAKALLEACDRPYEPIKVEVEALRQALNPPPPRPSKEECIKWLNRLVKSANLNEKDLDYRDAIVTHFFEKPSLQWVKNTGVEPDFKNGLVKFEKGNFSIGGSNLFYWNKNKKGYAETNFVKEYIILE